MRDKNPRPISPEDLVRNKAIMSTIAERALASVTHLKEAYLKDRNPVRVWDAIMQVHFAAPILGRPIEYPSWVLAYLRNAAVMIAGAAVTTPEPPVGGPIDANSSWFVGLNSEQRLRMVIEALGFGQGRGRSPLTQAIASIKTGWING